MRSALDYVALAERRHGRLSRPVDFAYIWGDALEVVPMQIHGFRLRRVSPADARWLAGRLHRESERLGCGVALNAQGRLVVQWQGEAP